MVIRGVLSTRDKTLLFVDHPKVGNLQSKNPGAGSLGSGSPVNSKR